MTERRVGAALACAVLVLALLVRAPIAEDWDGLGFVASVKTYDLAAFSPHPPGYPVYVVLLRAVAFVVRDAALAGAVLSALSLALSAYYIFRILAPRLGLLRAAAGASAGVLGSLALRSGSQVGTEALALAVLLAAVHLALQAPRETTDLGPDRSAARKVGQFVGLLAGLGLGVRLSWWPLYLGLVALVENRARLRALVSLGVGVLVWAVPLTLYVGPTKLYGLFATHGEGHALRFGRTLLHDGNVTGHLAAVARDLTADGLGIDATVLGIAIAIFAILGFSHFVVLWANAKLKPRAAIALALLAYGLFALLFQNVIESPRHLFPIVVAASVATGVGLSTPIADLAWSRAFGAFYILLLTFRATADARARTTEPPLGAQAVTIARAEPGFSQGDVAIFGGESARFAISENIAGGYAETLADVNLSLGSLDHLRKTIFVTSEIKQGKQPLRAERTLCRRERLDRKHPCLTLYRLTQPPQGL